MIALLLCLQAAINTVVITITEKPKIIDNTCFMNSNSSSQLHQSTFHQLHYSDETPLLYCSRGIFRIPSLHGLEQEEKFCSKRNSQLVDLNEETELYEIIHQVTEKVSINYHNLVEISPL
jgi:hypothetical protein